MFTLDAIVQGLVNSSGEGADPAYADAEELCAWVHSLVKWAESPWLMVTYTSPEALEGWKTRLLAWPEVDLSFVEENPEGRRVKVTLSSSDPTVLAGAQITMEAYDDFFWGDYRIFKE